MNVARKLGINAARKLSVDAFPDVTNVQVQIATEAPGRSPEEVERLIVRPLEDSLGTINGIETLSATASATTLPLPTALAGVTVRVRDNLNVERLAPLFFVSAEQINYLVPSGTANGLATVTVTNAGGEVSTGTVTISNVAPSLFAANANGAGVAAAVVFRRTASGQDSFEPVARFDPATGVVTYSYTLLAAQSHPDAGEDSIFESFVVKLTDVDGSSATASLDVRIVDDQPTIAVCHPTDYGYGDNARVVVNECVPPFLTVDETDLATDALLRWQLATRAGELPPYDEALLRREMALFPEWFVGRHLGRTMDATRRSDLERVETLLARSALAQPRVFVHRDYMPRNLMLCEPNPGVLDFQDAVTGPITYDMVSLVRDAFLSWDEERVLDWSVRYWEKAKKAGLPVETDFAEFWRAFEWMGLQRHLKVLGIFARLAHRDGKPKYLADKRTCVLPVKLEPGKTYAIWVNSGDKFTNFKDAGGRTAVPYLLTFKTKK